MQGSERGSRRTIDPGRQVGRSSASPTLRESLVRRAFEGTGEESRKALSTLYETYREPVYGFIRTWRHGVRYEAWQIEDLMQGFFARCIEKRDLVRGWDASRTRFRRWLFAALDHFLLNAWDWQRAQVRDQRACSFIEDLAAARRWREPCHGLTPEIVFDQLWAKTVIARAQAQHRARYRSDAKLKIYECLQPYLMKASTRDEQPPYDVLSRELGATPSSLKTRLCRMRQEWRAVLRATIADTVPGDAYIDDEIRSLLGSLSIGTGAAVPPPPRVPPFEPSPAAPAVRVRRSPSQSEVCA
jgi:hypothetical protein